MRATFTFSLLAGALVLASELNAAENQRPRPTTISVVGDAGPTTATADAPGEPAPRASLAPSRKVGQPPSNQNSVQFVFPDQSMGAWIEPVQIADNLRRVPTEDSGLRVARRDADVASRIVVVKADHQVSGADLTQSEPIADSTDSADESLSPQTPSYHRSQWKVFSEKPETQQASISVAGRSRLTTASGRQAAGPTSAAQAEREPTLAQERSVPRAPVRLAPAAPPLRDPAAPTDRTFSSDPAFLGELPKPAAKSIFRF